MTIRKKSKASQEESFVASARADVAARGKEAAERKQPFNLQMPESLYSRLKDYCERFEEAHGVKPSMTKIIMQALEERLEVLEKKL